jgi:hypothetical protein
MGMEHFIYSNIFHVCTSVLFLELSHKACMINKNPNSAKACCYKETSLHRLMS